MTAQSPSDPGPAASVPAFATELLLQQVHHDEDAQGVLWSLGRTWKARADADFAFIPCFGAAADKNYPVAFRLEEVRTGAGPFALATARATRTGDTVVFDRGAVVERYELGVDAVEQIFVVRERAAGPLTLRIRAETGLHAEDGPDGIRFRNAFGEVRYSQAFAVDADGGRVPLETRLAGGAIEIAISAEQMHDLPFPLTIDPVISTRTVFADLRDSIDTDTAHVAGANRYAVIWDRVHSALDHDVGIVLLGADGSYVAGSQSWIDISGDNWLDARVAANRDAVQFMVVAAVGDPAGGSRSIWVRTKLANGAFNMSMTKELEPGVAGDRFHPDVGGDPMNTDLTNYLVVWESTVTATNHDIRACRLNTSCSLVGSILTVIGNATDDRNPAVSASNGNGVVFSPGWNVVWDRDSGSDRDIYERRVSLTGSFGPIASVEGSALDTFAPSVSSDFEAGPNLRHAVAYVRAGASNDVGVSVRQNLSQVAGTTALSLLQGVPVAAREAPAIETDGCRLTVVYATSPFPGAFGKNIQAQVLHFVGNTLGLSGGPQDIAAGGNARKPSIAMPGTGGASSVASLVVWHERPIFVTPSTYYVAKAARFDAHAETGGVVSLPTACQGLQLAMNGIPAIGLSPTYSLLNASGPSFFVIGVPTTPFYVCPSCQVGVDLSLPYLVFNGPNLSIPIPCDGALVGLTVALQGADSGGNPACSQIRVSDTLLVQVQ